MKHRVDVSLVLNYQEEELKMHTVYWLHYTDETTIESEGYVGVTGNLHDRMKQHRSAVKHQKNSGVAENVTTDTFDDVVIEVVFQGTVDECLDKENFLRPMPDIGWNISAGGHSQTVSEKSKAKLSIKNTGRVSPKKGTKADPRSTAKMVATRKARGNYKPTAEALANMAATKARNGDCYNSAPVVVVVDGKTIEFTSIIEASAELGISYPTLRSRVRRGITRTLNGYSIEYKV